MKKLALLLGIAVLTFTSCSKDETPAGTSGAVAPLLLKTITSGDKVTPFTYSGNKIVTIGSETYTYTGDLITKKEATQSGNNFKFEYAYDNGKLISELMSMGSATATTMSPVSQTDYTYNTDGTVTAQNYTYQKGVSTASGTTKITLANNNIISIENFDTKGTSTGTAVYEFDSKINPWKNITGFDKLFDPVYSSKNNFTNSNQSDIVSGTTNTYTVSRVYTYNDKGYPLTIQSTSVYSYAPNTPTVSNLILAY